MAIVTQSSPSTPAGPSASATVDWSPVDAFRAIGDGLGTPAGSVTTGCAFSVRRRGTRTLHFTGVEFYWDSVGNETIRTRIWEVGTGASIATVDIVTSGAGVYTSVFAAPYAVNPLQYQTEFVASIWEISGTVYTKASKVSTPNALNPVVPFIGGSRLQWIGFSRWSAGDANPVSVAVSEIYLTAPVIVEP